MLAAARGDRPLSSLEISKMKLAARSAPQHYNTMPTLKVCLGHVAWGMALPPWGPGGALEKIESGTAAATDLYCTIN